MGSVSSLNPGVANLLQTLSNVNSPVLSSPAVTSALENAPTTDIVQLSQLATQLENVDMLFGIPNSSADSSTATLSSLLATLESPQTAPSAPTVPESSSTTSSTSTEAGQLASYQAALQSAETQTLFGTAPTLPDTSLLNLIG